MYLTQRYNTLALQELTTQLGQIKLEAKAPTRPAQVVVEGDVEHAGPHEIAPATTLADIARRVGANEAQLITLHREGGGGMYYSGDILADPPVTSVFLRDGDRVMIRTVRDDYTPFLAMTMKHRVRRSVEPHGGVMWELRREEIGPHHINMVLTPLRSEPGAISFMLDETGQTIIKASNAGTPRVKCEIDQMDQDNLKITILEPHNYQPEEHPRAIRAVIDQPMRFVPVDETLTDPTLNAKKGGETLVHLVGAIEDPGWRYINLVETPTIGDLLRKLGVTEGKAVYERNPKRYQPTASRVDQIERGFGLRDGMEIVFIDLDRYWSPLQVMLTDEVWYSEEKHGGVRWSLDSFLRADGSCVVRLTPQVKGAASETLLLQYRGDLRREDRRGIARPGAMPETAFSLEQEGDHIVLQFAFPEGAPAEPPSPSVMNLELFDSLKGIDGEAIRFVRASTRPDIEQEIQERFANDGG